jgi:hypothetical protein
LAIDFPSLPHFLPIGIDEIIDLSPCAGGQSAEAKCKNWKRNVSLPVLADPYLHKGMKEVFMDIVLDHWLLVLKRESCEYSWMYLAYWLHL